MAASVVACGDDGTSEGAEGDPAPRPVLHDEDTPIADGFVVPANAELVGTAFHLPMTDGVLYGWDAYLMVRDRPVDV